MSVSVDLALREHATFAAFELSTRTISRFLGPPRNLVFSEACELGTIALLDWIWSSSCTNPVDRTPGWSFTNYLRSDPHYYRWQFTKSLYAAAKRGDLAIVEWLFAHFDGCEAPASVVDAAASGGHLRILWYLREHRSRDEERVVDPSDISVCGITCTVKFDERCDAGKWGGAAVKKAVENGQLVECLDNGLQLGCGDRRIAINHAVNIGENELAERLVQEDKSILDYTYNCSRPEIIREMVDSGRFQWNEKYAALAFNNAAKRGNVELLQDIFQLHSPLRKKRTLWKRKWSEALEESCSHGNLQALQWLMEHSLAAGLLKEMKKSTLTSESMEMFLTAVESGHVEVLQYLSDKGLTQIGTDVTRAAVRGDKLVSLEWLADHIWMEYPKHFEVASAEAAQYGRLEMLKFLLNLYRSEYEAVLIGKKRVLIYRGKFWWSRNLSFCAANGGHMAVLKWVQENISEERNYHVKNTAASEGHLDTVKWLHANGCEGGLASTMLFAAEKGHFELVKWLYENCHKSRVSCAAIALALFYGHFKVACWLRKKYPNLTVTENFVVPEKLIISGNWQQDKVLEVLLYLRVFYPGALTPRILRNIRNDNLFRDHYKRSHPVELVLGWLDAHYLNTTEIPEW